VREPLDSFVAAVDRLDEALAAPEKAIQKALRAEGLAAHLVALRDLAARLGRR